MESTNPNNIIDDIVSCFYQSADVIGRTFLDNATSESSIIFSKMIEETIACFDKIKLLMIATIKSYEAVSMQTESKPTTCKRTESTKAAQVIDLTDDSETASVRSTNANKTSRCAEPQKQQQNNKRPREEHEPDARIKEIKRRKLLNF